MTDTKDTGSPEKQGRKESLLKAWGTKKRSSKLFHPDEVDIVVNHETGAVWVFHGKPLPYEVRAAEYDHRNHAIVFISDAGQRFDLGIKIQWALQPTLKKAEAINIMETKNREPVDWFFLPLAHVNTAIEEEKSQENAGISQATDNKDENGA